AFEALLYRTARELVTNVRKHASAGRLEVRLVEERDVVAGSAHDDSRGFDALDRGRTSMHVGLGTLVDRGQSAGGTVEIESHSPGGTRVEFRLPI
ncbi:MAG TPA: ATP-binding protein, partial [Gaiellales bacterium]|nr:ATP-binding protein [Gaiellales bacterium]